ILKKIEKTYSWKPSYGSLYPMLDQIEKEKLATTITYGNKKTYKITILGKAHLKKLNQDKKSLIQQLEKTHNMMKKMYGLTSKIDDKILNQLKNDKVPLSEKDKESTAMKKEVFRLLSSKKFQKNKTQIKKILNFTTKELKKIK